jgi:radical SAM superfamily enzyme YgiQ (UPF0313 family)
MKTLLVYPRYPDTFWSFRHALKFVSKKSSFPPLGLLTIAAMLPKEWEKRVVDMNAHPLKDADLRWADYVLVSAMVAQRDSSHEVIARAHALGKKVVAGGPLFTTGYADFPEVDHFVLNEAEVTLPLFLADLAQGKPQPIYMTTQFPELGGTPVPDWSLINFKDYTSMSLQYSRGCPFNCEFCDIIVLNGRRPRLKSTPQLLKEMDSIYRAGWSGSVFIVDDNFIGNKRVLKEEILPAIIEWQTARNYPFQLLTEASINLADDDQLMELMVKAGFDSVFIGIETPNEDSLAECAKSQNQGRDLVSAVKLIQNMGMQVMGGFIVGFDNDPLSIFKRQVEFIQKSGIVTAMVGLLNAPPGTRLFHRLKEEKRLVSSFSGNNMDCSMNFIPRMDLHKLMDGYHQILNSIYNSRDFYTRVRTFLDEFRPAPHPFGGVKFQDVRALFRSIWLMGVIDRGRKYYWKLILDTLRRRPRLFHNAVTLTIYGYHFRKIVQMYSRLPIEGEGT